MRKGSYLGGSTLLQMSKRPPKRKRRWYDRLAPLKPAPDIGPRLIKAKTKDV